ncbi:FAD-binding and (Fe-S)-binding domain-containing protein [Roseivirga sp. BDSF3-8]|uniref:FAD-binding and (Fe-S)-binding domain-containing protein n=1 Tax=Roseivirga sp. BDSF3-8 TaxID=3241598 RepID=UPI0035323A6B
MAEKSIHQSLSSLSQELEGDFYFDDTMRILYATDASAYRELPLAVAIPKSEEDLNKLIRFARKHKVSLIPRAAGTSLAGQVVGSGIVVDISKHFTRILEINKEEGWVRLQPGVIRNELNMALKEHGLFFGPETSTANRAMIGGMLGNNSCGANSVVYGSVRDHLLEVKALLSDGSEVTFGPLTNREFEAKCNGPEEALETKLYLSARDMFSDEGNRNRIIEAFPKPSIPRRNTGYALDLLMEASPFVDTDEPFNFCKLLAGSEGTLALVTEIKVHADPLPPATQGLCCVHFNNVDEALRANLIALKYNPSASELMDAYILECTKANIEQRQNRFFVEGEPGAILMVEISKETEEEVRQVVAEMEGDMREAGLGYHFPLLFGEKTARAWNLRKAGLGLLSNIKGDAKPAPVIEDTAVDVNDLPAYIADFNIILEKHGLYCVHYAHAGSGELHLRPILDLKTHEGNRLFHKILEEIATLVKKYRGSLSGEHGDGRLRGEFLRFMIGDENYALVEEVKNVWDPEHIFNPNKIVDTPPMNESLRYWPGQKTPHFETVFDFSEADGIQRAAELCNGSGDCRKTHLTGGTMCPSYMATHNEKDTTRARANILREVLTQAEGNPFADKKIGEVMDLCLSCKGCKAECPSNVDVGKMKAEYLQQHYDVHGVPFRSRLVANYTKGNDLASIFPGAYNFLVGNKFTGGIFRKLAGFHPSRSLPPLHQTTLRKWFNDHAPAQPARPVKEVAIFCDEFTNFNDVPVGQTALRLLTRLGYKVLMPEHEESGRTWISKGLLRDAKEIAIKNVNALAGLAEQGIPVIGIEPSALLTLRDEYLSLVPEDMRAKATALAEVSLLFEEFIAAEREAGNITPEQFITEKRLVRLHGHCHQKALSSLVFSKKALTLPAGYEVRLIPSGCCGMAGSFGYEKEHYDLSMSIGELVLFPAVRDTPAEAIVCAPGTSCRHQIKDGTDRVALHPVEVLWQALAQ